ncbi:MAG: DUF3575 domain-containing protein [Tannerellaceae bacterium]|nr:DUF3575 domain-containing protein [Tannerellaceae bacterium]
MVRSFIRLFLFTLILATPVLAKGQTVGVKTNLLYWGTGTPNMGAEWGFNEKSSLDFQVSYNPWNIDGSDDNNKKIAHWMVRPEYRYWFCEKFMGHYVGAHAFYAQYNIAGHKIPLLLESDADQFRYKGDMYGIGISYGYHLILNRYFSLEFTLGVGYARMSYDKFQCVRCGDKLSEDTRNYFGPTRAGISLVYVFNKK